MTWVPRLRLALLILAVVVLQTTVFSAGLRVSGVMPDLGLVLTVAVAFYLGPDRGAVFGFVAGLAVDLFLSTPLGLSALSFAVVGYAVGVVQGGGATAPSPSALRASPHRPDEGRNTFT